MIFVVGVGALGSHLVTFLRNIDQPIFIIDYDRVETRNVQAQAYTKPNVGKLKVDALKQLMQFSYGADVANKIKTNSNKLTGDNVNIVFPKETKLIVDCLDNGEARRLVQGYARKNNVPCLHGALAPGGEYGQVIWTDLFKIDEESGAGAPTCENGETLPFIVVVAATLALAVKAFLDKGQKLSFGLSPRGSTLLAMS